EKPLTLERLSALAKRCLSHASLKPVALGESIQRAGGRHWLALEMLERFLGELSATKRRWQEALQNQGLTALRHEAHQLSGACRYVGVPALENALERFNASSNVGQAMREGEHVVREIERLLDWSDNVELPLLFEDSENLMPRPTPSEE
ncbi:Hpt domain-containing protein, partial [Litorivivens sp.]